MKLYVYDHCPFCIRPRMIMGLKNIETEQIFLANDDEDTPISMIGKKMLPILATDEGTFIGESLDIVTYLDQHVGTPCLTLPDDKHIEAWIDSVSETIFKLTIPRWVCAGYPEFEKESARNYFIIKKEAVFGSFIDLMKNSDMFIEAVNDRLHELESTAWSMTDIILYPVLRALSIVEGIFWPAHVDKWRKNMAKQCGISLEDDIAF